MKLKGLLLAGICAIGLQAQDFQPLPYKASIGVLGGYSQFKVNSGSEGNWIGGINFKYETKIKHSNTYYGFGADFLQSADFKHSASYNGVAVKTKMEMNTISVFGTIGQQFTKNISANLYAGPSYNKIEGKLSSSGGGSASYEDSKGKLGYMLGASINYGTSGLVQELMVRHTAADYGNLFNTNVGKVSSTGLFYRIGISF